MRRRVRRSLVGVLRVGPVVAESPLVASHDVPRDSNRLVVVVGGDEQDLKDGLVGLHVEEVGLARGCAATDDLLGEVLRLPTDVSQARVGAADSGVGLGHAGLLGQLRGQEGVGNLDGLVVREEPSPTYDELGTDVDPEELCGLLGCWYSVDGHGPGRVHAPFAHLDVVRAASLIAGGVAPDGRSLDDRHGPNEHTLAPADPDYAFGAK